MLVGRGKLPVRSVRNHFTEQVQAAEHAGMPQSDPAAYEALLASASLKQASFDGDVAGGKVEAGQCAGLIDEVLPAAQIMAELVTELHLALKRLNDLQN
ncbi:hypothetical protein D3C79_885320 [compost metagenome]